MLIEASGNLSETFISLLLYQLQNPDTDVLVEGEYEWQPGYNLWMICSI